MPWLRKVWDFLSAVGQFTIKGWLRCVSSSVLLLFERVHTNSGPALRPGTATVVKISAGLDCVPVSSLGSVVTEVRKFQSTEDSVNACVSVLEWSRWCSRFLRVHVGSPRRNHTIGTDQGLSMFCCQAISERW